MEKVRVCSIIIDMENKRFEIFFEQEHDQKIAIEHPPVELFNEAHLDAWPEHISSDEDFLRQLKSREELNKRLDAVFSGSPRLDTSLQDAIAKDKLTENEVADLYSALSSIISDNDYKRIILYLPFEFLPDKDWEPSSEKLQLEAAKFRDSYMDAWNRLLITHDVRANFADGDILEEELWADKLPRVVKVAHLMPKLVEKGFLRVEDVFALFEKTDDEVLKHSIADTFPVLADLGFLKEKEINQIKLSSDSYISNKAEIITSSKQMPIQEKEIDIKDITCPLVQERLNGEFQKIENAEYGEITENRKIWLMRENKKRAVEAAGDDMKKVISSGAMGDEILSSFISSEADCASRMALIEGIRKAIEDEARTNRENALELYNKYRETLSTFWKFSELRESLSKTFYRLYDLDIVDEEQLNSLGITKPALAGPFSENLKAMEEETGDIKNIIARIESDAEISRYIYPAVIIMGSQLKGYGSKNSDIDIAVFVKPDASFADMENLRILLKEKFNSERMTGEVIQFWLEKTGEELRIRDFGETKAPIGESYMTPALFGSAWEGDQSVIRELREKLLVPYLYNDKKKIFGHDARKLYIEELERDTLQYRLMHKGYEKFFPPHGGINAPHADEIDGKSMFWDSCYRRLATKLYARRVFLPKISRK
ncbi:MAG: nucleotidyltransferase domain-containing protein [bacterium]